MFAFRNLLGLTPFHGPAKEKQQAPVTPPVPFFPFFDWMGGQDPAPKVPGGMTTAEGVPLTLDYAQQWVDASQPELPANSTMPGVVDLDAVDPDAEVQTRESGAKLKLEQDQLGVGHATSTTHAKGDDSETNGAEMSATLGPTGLTLADRQSRSTSTGRDFYATSASEANTREIELGLDHVQARAGRETEIIDATGSHKTASSAGIGASDGKIDLTLGKSETATRPVTEKNVKGEDVPVDKTSGRASTMGASFNTDEATVKWGKTDTHEDGSGTGFSADATANWDEGKFGGNVAVSRKDAAGNETSFGGGGNVNFGENGLQGVDVNASAKAGGVGVKGKAGIDVDVTAPQLIDGRWVVHWRRTISGGVGVSAENKRGGVNAGANGSKYEMGTRTFATELDARRFHDEADTITRAIGPSATTLEGAYQLAIGESRGEGETLGVEAGASGKAGPVTVGAEATMNSAGQVEVRRASSNVFEVTVSDSSGQGLTGSLGGYGVTASHGESSSANHLTTVRFDVTTPEGRAAFEEYCRTREVPKEGGQVVAHEDGKGHETTDGFDIMGIGSSKIAGRTWEKTRWDEEGKHEEYGGAHSHDVNYRYLGSWLGGDETHKSFQVLGKQEDDEDDGYLIDGRFSGESALSNLDGMYQLTGRNDPRNRDEIGDGKASGNWHLTSELDMERVNEYCEFIRDNRDFDYGEIHEFQEAVRNAKSNDDKMRAVAAYVAGKGYSGLKNLGAQDMTYDVELEGDRNFPGRAGRLQLEAKLEGYGGLLEASAANGPSVLNGLQSEIDALKQRRAAVADMKAYDDLPLELRQEELAKLDALMHSFTALRNQAAEASVGNVAGEDMMAFTDRQALDEEGKGLAPRDPKQLALYHLRDEISVAQLETRRMVAESARAKDAVRQTIDGGRGLRNGDIKADYKQHSQERQTADAIDELRLGLDVSVNELRMAFLRSLDNPDAAMATGGLLLSQLKMQESLAYDANQHYETYARATREMTKASYREGIEYWDDMAEQDELNAAADEPAEIEMEPMDMRPKKSRRHG